MIEDAINKKDFEELPLSWYLMKEHNKRANPGKREEMQILFGGRQLNLNSQSKKFSIICLSVLKFSIGLKSKMHPSGHLVIVIAISLG